MNNYKDTNPINNLPEQIKSYLNTKVDLISLFAVKRIGQIIPPIVVGFIIAFTLLFFTLFISYSFIQWYADYVGKASTASLIVSGFYLALSLLVYFFRKQLIYNPIQKSIVSGLNFKDLHKASNISKLENFSELNKELERIAELSDKEDENLNENIEDIKEYYTFDAIKTRFIDEIFQNPRPAIALVLQSIMSISSIRKKHKERKTSKS
jgi:hypothetical protein